MLQRLLLVLLAAALLTGAPALAAAPQPTQKIDINAMLGRWYEVARIPNARQKGCERGASDWKRAGAGFSVVQACYKGAAAKPTEWRAKAEIADPATNAKIRMSFLGGMLNQEYWVLEYRRSDGWLILATPGGNYLWLMSTKPTLTAAARTAALTRIRQLGYDVNKLEFPKPLVN